MREGTDSPQAAFVHLVEAAARLELAHVTELEAIRRRLDALEARPAMYTVPEFARLCGCSPRTVERAIAAGRIRVVELGPQTRVIPATELDGEYRSARCTTRELI